MTGLIDFLPLLEGWIYEPKEITPTVISPGEEKRLMTKDKPGWVYHVSMMIDNPDAELIIRLWRETRFATFAMRARTAQRMGLTAPNPTGFYCPKYDDTAGEYTLCYFPVTFPGIRKRFEFALRSPSGSSTSIKLASCCYISIEEKEAFISSLRDVLGVKEILARELGGG